MSKVLILLADGFEEIEAISIIDVLRRGGVKVIAAAISNLNVVGKNNIKVIADTHIDNISSEDFDMIVLPGGDLGCKNLAVNQRVLDLLQEFDKAGKQIGAICAAPFVLHKAGVLKTQYTCYPSIELAIGKSGYIADKNVVADDNILTSRGAATAIEFGLAILKKLKGEERSKSVAKDILA